ncbi:MAG: hypothetical protein M3336_17650, partial [Chloroflexota bacterium]|nr:hypothetical protein [Chloroflexota bacterium]
VAVYAEQFDAAAGDYTRFLVARGGTARVTDVSSGDIGRVELSLSLDGEWRDRAGTLLGCGQIAGASVSAPLLRLGSGTGRLIDTLTATVAVARDEELATSTLDAFQVLHPGQVRLAVVGSVARDSTRQLWLSLDGIPTGGTITLGEPTLEEARAGRAARSFGMLRVNPPSGGSSGQLWRSTSGEVELTNVVQAGPFALCGWVSGRYGFEAIGTDLSSGTPLGGRIVANGVFESKFTVLSPSDSLAGTERRSSVARFARSVWAATAPPSPATGGSCPF